MKKWQKIAIGVVVALGVIGFIREKLKSPEQKEKERQQRIAQVAKNSKQTKTFLALAKKGVPYDKPIVNEDLYGRKVPAHLVPAIQHQQLDHMKRSLAYAKNQLELGVRWRS